MFNISLQTASDSCRLGQSWSGAHKMPSFYFLFVFWRVKSFSFTVDPESDHCCCQVGDREVVTWHVRGRELLPLLCDRCDPKETLGRLSAFSSPFIVTATWNLFCRLSFDDRIIMTSQWVWNYFRFRPQSVVRQCQATEMSVKMLHVRHCLDGIVLYRSAKPQVGVGHCMVL